VGVGFTIIVYVKVGPTQVLAVGVIVIVAVIGDVVVLIAVKDGGLPIPFAPSPTAVLLLVHVKLVPDIGPDNDVRGATASLQ